MPTHCSWPIGNDSARRHSVQVLWIVGIAHRPITLSRGNRATNRTLVQTLATVAMLCCILTMLGIEGF
jgi:hypothetical protein